MEYLIMGVVVFRNGYRWAGLMPWNDRIHQRLKLRDLHYFMTVVQAGSMAKAAPMLSVTQPVLSKAIAEMELLLGVRLLDRSLHGVEATAYGARLLASAHAVFDELRLGVKEIEHLSDPSAGELFVGSNEASSIGIVPAAIERIRREHPRIVVRVLMLNTPSEQFKALRERSIDFVIGRISQTADLQEFETEVLFEQRQLVVAGAGNPITRRENVKLSELMNEPWILPPGDTTSGQLAADLFRINGLPLPRAAVVTQSFQLNRGLLERGPFLALMPATILSAFAKHSSLKRVAVSLPHQVAPVGVIKLRHRAPSPLANKFVDLARSLVRDGAYAPS